LHVQWTVTSPSYQPAPFGAVVAAPVIVGAVWSTFTLTVASAGLPAASVACPVADWLAPSATNGTGPSQLEMPERVSSHANDTVTGASYQPAGLAGRSGLPVIVGGV